MFLALVFHNHQPVGQLPWALEDAWRDSYQPFLEVLERHPAIKVGLHYSGTLLDWLAEYKPQTITQVRRLVERGQVEILTGGYHEPVLVVWPEADQLAQVQRLNQRVHELFGVAPRGLWLTERVWEPQLADLLPAAGITYTCVDSTAFAAAGVAEEDSCGYFQALPTAAPQSRPLAVIAINQPLRHLIPWQPGQYSLNYLRQIEEKVRRAGRRDALVLFADDGEKFGGWPGTFDWVFTQGWLDQFFAMLSAHAAWLTTITPGAYLEKHDALGQVNLPAGSYAEMQEWSGGNWRNFLARYGESRDMAEEVLRVRATVCAAPEAQNYAAAYEHILQAQCNDSYWHGTFGGLYLRHLRQAVYAHAAAAQTLAEEEASPAPINVEPSGDLIINNRLQKLGLRAAGGHIFLWLSKPARHNLLSTLRRYSEPYHDAAQATEFDWYPRGALLDHFFGDAAHPTNFATGRYPEQGDFITEPWELHANLEESAVTVLAQRTGGVWTANQFRPLAVEKILRLPHASGDLNLSYKFTNPGAAPLDLWWGTEWNLSLSGCDLPDRHYHADDHKLKLRLDAPAQFEAVTNPIVADRWLQLWVEWEFAQPWGMWHVPLRTVSQKEGGAIEEMYQQSALVFHRRLHLEPESEYCLACTVRVTSGATG
ncbi:MAG TPA: alpha-amylase/4-alpha-glucanotransferase domain-containing protein [Abditibacteriaceae bacterium]|nr:alpha-amylase/4-alpha-glucanotransferase domain-containing protein [Abditibacteriaceae bacterium]